MPVAQVLTPLARARAQVLAASRPLAAEAIALHDALGRVLAEPVHAAADVPGFDNSAMDGFALRAGTAGRRLVLAGEARAGAPAVGPLGAEEAMAISTGAALPQGADAVLELERAEVREGAVIPRLEVAPGRNVRRAGEDVRAGSRVLAGGRRLGPVELGLAAGAGAARVHCARRPRLALVATGDELVAPGQVLGPGQIYDSNRIALAGLAARGGAEVVLTRHVGDSPAATVAALDDALGAADVVLASGGVSVGAHDHVRPALERIGVSEIFWGIALRPGKPTWFGTRGRQLCFGLPGNPVSALVTFLLLVRPALARLQGAWPLYRTVPARLGTAVPRRRARDEAIRVRLVHERSGPRAVPTGAQGSHILSSMLDADGLALIPAGEGELPAGEPVTIELI